jgi:hypothetical protein
MDKNSKKVKKLLLFILFLISSFVSYSQVIEMVDKYSIPDVKVYVTDNLWEADAVVCRIENVYRADNNRGFWYVINNYDRYHYDCAIKVTFVERWYEADVIVAFTRSRSRVRCNSKYLRYFIK